jgi:hypothetical protein
MRDSLIIPAEINRLSKLEQVRLFHSFGDTVFPLDPPGKNGKNGKTPLFSGLDRRLSDKDIEHFFGNGADYNLGCVPGKAT